MASIYLVRRGDEWRKPSGGYTPYIANADIFPCRETAERTARRAGGEPVEFREVGGDTAAGALAAAEATIARLRQDLELLRKEIALLSNRPSTHELAKRHLESTDDPKLPLEVVVRYLENHDVG